MSRREDQSEFLDNFDVNKDMKDRDKEEDKNDYFIKNRGGFGKGDFRGEIGRGDFREGRGGGNFRGDFRRGRNGGDFRRERDGGDFRRGRGGFRGGRGGIGRGDFRGRNGGDFRRGNNGREYRGEGRDYFQKNFRDFNNKKPNYFDDEHRNYKDMENNFQRNVGNEENNEEYQIKKEAQYEKEKFWNDFKKKYKDIIEAFKVLFVNEQPTDEEIYQIIININKTDLTIFEAMNLIYREIQIIKTLQFVNSGQKRDYGPNQDILEQHKNQYLPKNNLKEVIQKYKIYQINTDNTHIFIPEKSWLFFDNVDRRRKLIKDELGFFNYLPLLNPKGMSINEEEEEDVYAKNENELLYHYLYYKTLMCKHCSLSDEIKLEKDLCPYSHDILKDFRIIYDSKSEEICSFMKILLKSKLFNFVDYINYIPMSLTPDFNFDTFKVHQCQLDKGCPNDYHVCPYYHKSIKGDEQRRPPLLFDYSGNPGDVCFDEKNKKYCPKKCPCGIFCQYLHNKNEYNYHPEHFRKEYDCKRKKINGKCIYYKTCYGIHSNESNESSEEEQEEIEDDNIKDEEIFDDKIEESKKRLDVSFIVGKFFRCRKCQKISENGELCYFIKCKHFICVKCFKKMSDEYKKKNKKDKKLLLSCPFCDNKLEKGEVIKVSFKC